MTRIAGVDLPGKKRIDIALNQIYGIGRSNVNTLLKKASVDKLRQVDQLTEEEKRVIQKVIDKEFKIEGDLRTEVQENIKRLKEIGSYKGLRHIHNLPVRGQRTRSNARTKRGKRRTIGAMRREMRVKLETSQSSKSKTAK